VLTLLVLNVVVAIFLINRMTEYTRQLVELEEPLEEAVLEMEINAGEAARALLDYVREQKEHNIDKMNDSYLDFERWAKEFERLVETESERALGHKVAGLYLEFKALANEIASSSKRRSDDLQVFRKDYLEIDRLIDEELQRAIDHSAADALMKLEAALDMEINTDEAFAAIEGYVLLPKPEAQRRVADSEADFKRFEAQYRATSLSAGEKDVLARIDKGFAETVTAGKEIIALTDELNENLGKFEAILEEIDRILDDEIQPMIHGQTERAGTDARRTGTLAVVFMIAIGLFIFIVVVGVGLLVSKGIINATNQLTKGAEQFAQGNLDHRIEVQSRDEFSVLAATFNEMADNIRRLAEDNRRYQEDLEQRVEERTAALAESEERYRAVAEDTPVLICRFRPGGEIAFVNQAYCRYFEKTSGELVGSSFLLNTPAEGRETVMANIETLTADSPTQSFEQSVITAGGEIRWQRWTIHALFDNEGKVVTYQSIGEDITDQKRVEEEKVRLEEQYYQAQKADSIGRLAGGVSHDLNNLLLPIIGYAEMLLEDKDPEDKRREFADEILRAGIRARNLVRQLLAFSRKQTLEYKPVNLNEAILNFKKLLRRTIREDIEIEFIPSIDIQTPRTQ
jgi:PAS domain S-box-containing protein